MNFTFAVLSSNTVCLQYMTNFWHQYSAFSISFGKLYKHELVVDILKMNYSLCELTIFSIILPIGSSFFLNSKFQNYRLVSSSLYFSGNILDGLRIRRIDVPELANCTSVPIFYYEVVDWNLVPDPDVKESAPVYVIGTFSVPSAI